MTENYSKDDNAKHVKMIMEGELQELVETGRGDFKNNGVTDRVTAFCSTEYYIHSISNNMDQTNNS